MKKLFVLVIVSILLLGGPASVMAYGDKPAKNGFYVGMAVPYNQLEGDLDGNTVLVGAGEVILVPEIDGALGWGMVLGGRSDYVAVEFTYVASDHDVTFSGASGDAEYHSVNFDLKIYLTPQHKVQPYLLLGLGSSRLTVIDGASDGFIVGDAKFKGGGFNFGGGIGIYPIKRLGINVGVVYRNHEFRKAEGVSGYEYDIAGDLDASGLNYLLNITYTF